MLSKESSGYAGVIRHYGNRPNAHFAQRISLHHDAVDRRLHVGTVIANENHKRAFWPADLGKRVGPAVDALKGEVLCLPPDRWVVFIIRRSPLLKPSM